MTKNALVLEVEVSNAARQADQFEVIPAESFSDLVEKIHGGKPQSCSRYAEMIEDMKSRGGGFVATLGDWGHLHSEPEYEYVKVPPVTHEATCYLGFIGECPEN